MFPLIRRSWRRFTACLVIACLLALTASTGMAAPITASPVLPAHGVTSDVVALFDPFVRFQNQGYVLTAVPKGATVQQVEAVKQQISRANELVLALQSSDLGGLTYESGKVGVLSLGGEDKIEHFWYGMDWYIGHANSQALAYALNSGAALSTILAIILGIIPLPPAHAAAIALAIAAALFAWGADTLTYFDKGRGVVIEIRFGIPTGVRSQ